MSKQQERILSEIQINIFEKTLNIAKENGLISQAVCSMFENTLLSHRAQTEYIEALESSGKDFKRYKTALSRIVCLNIPMPDEVFNLANNALEGID